jgi:hypothetical protein
MLLKSLSALLTRPLVLASLFLAFCVGPLPGFVANAHALDVDQVAGFEVIVAGACDDGFNCAFGHSFLRIVMRGRFEGDDPVLAFTTNAKEPQTFIEKLKLSGMSVVGLPLLRETRSLNSIVRLYSRFKNRTISRIPLQVTEKNEHRLVEKIDELFFRSTGPKIDEATAYNFLSSNCACNIVAILNEAGVPREIFGIAIPMNLGALGFGRIML